jgi:hypothetical protein
MVPAAFTLLLAIAALAMAMTPRGLVLLGSNRGLIVAALAVLGILQGYRVLTAWRRKKLGHTRAAVPKRPLGI